jgi:hypothetical protein
MYKVGNYKINFIILRRRKKVIDTLRVFEIISFRILKKRIWKKFPYVSKSRTLIEGEEYKNILTAFFERI